MKKTIIISIIITALGLLIALGPQFLFKVCSPKAMHAVTETAMNDEGCGNTSNGCRCGGSNNTTITYPTCHWTAQAVLGLGFLITALGLCMIVFTDLKTHLGLIISIFFIGIVVLFIPHGLIGGCGMMTMACRRAAFPAITIIDTILLVISAGYVIYILKKTKNA